MATIAPYLRFNGTCEAAFMFYKSVFGTEFEFIGKFGDMPSEEPMSDANKNKVMHVSLPIGPNHLLFGSDTMEGIHPEVKFGDNMSISITTDSEAEADKLFNGLYECGTITMPIAKTFWNAYFGMFTDKFGVHWMVNFDYK
jgi:PhnB protein